MLSDPTDLISIADAELSDPGALDADSLLDLVRRLRATLGVAVTVGELAEAERDTARAEVRVLTGRVEQERSQAFHLRAALAEVNATIERVQAIVDDPTLKDYAALAAVRRALAKREEP